MNRAAGAAIALSLGLALSACNTGAPDQSFARQHQAAGSRAAELCARRCRHVGRPAGRRAAPPGRLVRSMNAALRRSHRHRRCNGQRRGTRRRCQDCRPLRPAGRRRRAGDARLCRSGQGPRRRHAQPRLRPGLPRLDAIISRTTLNNAHHARLWLRGQREPRRHGRRSAAPAARRDRHGRDRNHELDQGHRNLS